MSIIVIAKKDFQDAIRSRGLLALTVLFTVFITGGVCVSTLIPKGVGVGGNQTSITITLGLLPPTGLLVPIIGLLAGYKAVAGEREDGSLKFLLGLPHTRRDVILGKVLGRAAVVTVSIIIGFAVGGVALHVLTNAFSLANYLVFIIATIQLGVVFVSLGVALSTVTSSTAHAAWGVFGLFAIFHFIWEIVGFIVVFISTGSLLRPPVPGWYLLFMRLNPQNAYQAAATAKLSDSGLFADALVSDPTSGLSVLLEGWVGFVLLALWSVIPLGLAYSQFQRSDL